MINEALGKVAKQVNLPVEVVENTYKAYWLYIKETIEALPLKDNLTEGEFKYLRTNFNLPSLGKLYCTLNRYNKIKKRFNYIKELIDDTEDNKD